MVNAPEGLYFDDPRLHMTLPGRMFVRVMAYVSYLLLIVATITFLFSDLRWLQFVGVGLGLFLIDRWLHAGQGDAPLRIVKPGTRTNATRFLSTTAFALLERAFDRSALRKENGVLALCEESLRIPAVRDSLRRLDVDVDAFSQKLSEFLDAEHSDAQTKDTVRAQMEGVVLAAYAEALQEGHRFIGDTDLFAAALTGGDPHATRLLDMFSVDAPDVSRALAFGALRRRYSRLRAMPQGLGGIVPELMAGTSGHRIMNRAWTSRPTPTLDKYGIDFTDLAREESIGLLIGHDEEYARILQSLARAVNPNALLIGEIGSGKETLVAHLAFDISHDTVDPALMDKRLVGLQLSSLIAGATPEDLQARLEKIVREIMIAGNVILYIPDIHNLVRTSGSAYLSAADALMPVIMNNAFPVLGSTYPREFREFIEPRSDFAGLFEKISVNEIAEDDAEKILTYESVLLERRYKIIIAFSAIKTAVRVAKQYIHAKLLPSSAEELLKESVVAAAAAKEKVLEPARIIAIAEQKVNIPIHQAGADEAKALLHLEDTIHQRFIDQDEAVKAVADALREYRSGLARPGGPIASFLFVGPTGVGKTELSKILAGIQFGSESAMVRFDMTEYQDKQSFYRFIGSPDGTTDGMLTRAVLDKPYSLILLDEFEKAFPDILNLFLQVLDDGRLTDNLGRTIDFKNTIVIATSNAHSDIINESLSKGERMADIAAYLKTKLTDVFRPELLNRFSKIVVFKDLGPAEVEAIARINLKDLAGSLSAQKITLTFDDEAVKKVAKLGYDPAFGARPLRRVIEEKLRAVLAQTILQGALPHGAHITLTVKDDEFAIVPDA